MSLLGVSNFDSFCSTPPPTWTPSPATVTGIRPNPCATPLLDGQSGPLANTTPTTGYEPNFCIDVSSEHTPINFPSRKDSFNLESDLTKTVAASWDFGHFRKLVQGNEFVATVGESMLRGKRDHNLDSVSTMSDRQKLHDYLERKAESAVRGEIAAQKRLSEAKPTWKAEDGNRKILK